MANYKVVDADQLDAAMSATADSIRAKSGGTDPVVWDLDNGFRASVDGIQTGGAGGSGVMNFESSASGGIPSYQHGTAESVLDMDALNFEGNAVGSLTE